MTPFEWNLVAMGWLVVARFLTMTKPEKEGVPPKDMYI